MKQITKSITSRCGNKKLYIRYNDSKIWGECGKFIWDVAKLMENSIVNYSLVAEVHWEVRQSNEMGLK